MDTNPTVVSCTENSDVLGAASVVSKEENTEEREGLDREMKRNEKHFLRLQNPTVREVTLQGRVIVLFEDSAVGPVLQSATVRKLFFFPCL
jgi:hypothetical protein